MKIGIFVGDLDPLKGGESTLTKTIMLEIQKSHDDSFEYVFLYYNKSQKKRYSFMNEYKFINISNCCNIRSLVLNGLIEIIGGASNRYFVLDKIAKHENIDVFYFAAPIFAQTSLPYIFTVWDLGHRSTLYFPEVSEADWGYREKMYSRMLNRATYILTANETGKKEILKYYNVDADRIQIIPFPVTSLCFCEEKRPDFLKEGSFFFYPAQFWPHKNHIVIVEALSVLKKEFGKKPIVYFTGSDKGNKGYIIKKSIEYGVNDQIVFAGFIDEGELKYLYTHAKAMIFASLMGPNNLPPIEAKYLNCPILLSDIPGHIDQMGDSAVYFNGYNCKDLAYKMNELLVSINSKNINGVYSDVDYFIKVIDIFKEIKTILYRWKDV